MEVHPPEDAVHTVREFLIHMLAIVLGLLIAIGLEQSVEGLHRLHERHELEENMRAEAERNVEILTTHLDVSIPELVQYRAHLAAVRAAVARDGFVDITLPPRQMKKVDAVMDAPERDVWPVSLASSTSGLLPEPMAQMYSHVDYNATEDEKEVDRMREASALLTRFSLATGYEVRPNEALHPSLAEREQLVVALSTEVQQLFQLLHRDNLFLLDCQGVLKGFDNVRSLEQWVTDQPKRLDAYR
jgi:hypothetical protein